MAKIPDSVNFIELYNHYVWMRSLPGTEFMKQFVSKQVCGARVVLYHNDGYTRSQKCSYGTMIFSTNPAEYHVAFDDGHKLAVRKTFVGSLYWGTINDREFAMIKEKRDETLASIEKAKTEMALTSEIMHLKGLLKDITGAYKLLQEENSRLTKIVYEHIENEN